MQPNVTTTVNGTIAASGLVTIESSLTASALGDYEALNFGLFAGAGTDTVTATDSSVVEAKVGGSGRVSSSGADVNVLAYHNYDGTHFETGQTVTTQADAITVSLGLSISSNNLTSTAEATTKAEVDSGGNISAIGHVANVRAFSGNYATSFVQNSGGAILNVSVNSDPTSVASGDTEANLNGNVTGVSGPGADTLNVLAEGNDTATAGMKEDGGGLLSVTDSQSHSSGSPTTAVTLGGNASTIRTGHDITASAFESYDSDASTSSATGGAINVSGFTATAGMTPISMASVTGGATITSDNGSISVDATANQPPAPVSDGHFDAAGISNNTITFLCNGTPCQSNATTGNPVTYSGTTAGGLTNGRVYSVIVTGADTVQLGATFVGGSGGNVDMASDTIDFGSRDPHLQTGDIVIYSPICATTCVAGATVNGLSAGTAYEVVGVTGTGQKDAFGNFVNPNDHQVRLQLQGFTSTTVTANGGDVSGNKVNVSGFSNGDLVTYHAPNAQVEFSSGQVNLELHLQLPRPADRPPD